MSEAKTLPQDGAALRAAVEHLMFSDAPKNIASFRACTGWVDSFDLVKVRVCVPEVSDQGDIEGGEFGEEVFERELCGPRGLIELLVVELESLCARLDEFRVQVPAGLLPTDEDDGDGVSAESAADETGAAPTGPADGTAISEPAGAAIDEGGDDTDAEFAGRMQRSPAYDFAGPEVAPLGLQLCLPGADALLDIPLLVVPAGRHALVQELRAVAARWADQYAAAVRQDRIG